MWILSSLLLFGLTGCLLASGERTTTDIQDGNGNVSSSFVSAEGRSDRSVKVTEGEATLQVIGFVSVESGDLTLELLEPNGAVVFAVASQPGNQVTRSGQVTTDAQGQVRYRVVAQGARNGNYQLLFQR
ncbi:MAG: hypothetical protein MUD01_07740 [Chloroflexaceae bacterium]|jgi:hypothetical protein|nr:hypothetical protein [Chloroflexaceae bacterium]